MAMGPDNARNAANELAQALAEHAEVINNDDSVEQVMTVLSRLRESAAGYASAVFNESGWGNPFEDLFGDEDPEGVSVDDEDPPSPDDGLMRVSVVTRADFVVHDPDALVAYARQRLASAQPELTDEQLEEYCDHPITALSELNELDGWDTDAYDEYGIQSGGSGLRAEQVNKTLWELSDEDDESDL
jgi:hypothetical protein